jgi:dGTPase
VHSKAFRRLKHKTQVFLSPEGDHYRTRLTHTLEVSQISRTIARALSMNEDLTEAIALGHDLGHTPFGHSGERVLNKMTNGYFEHNKQSLRVVDILEDDNNSNGLNLTFEVRDGIVNHTSKGNPATLEGKIVSYSDRIAYINHDIDDAIRAGILREEDLPKDCVEILGNSKGRRINTMVLDIIHNSLGKNVISFSKDIDIAANNLRKYMFDNLYINSEAKKEEYKAENIIEYFYNTYDKNPDLLPDKYLKLLNDYEKYVVICDYIASMTDRYLIKKFEESVIPGFWNK